MPIMIKFGTLSFTFLATNKQLTWITRHCYLNLHKMYILIKLRKRGKI